MEEPESKNLRKLATRLFESTAEQDRFIKALRSGDASSPAVLWLEEPPENRPFPVRPRVSWQPEFVDAVERESKAGAHQLHEEGAYYCLNLSSVFQIMVAAALEEAPQKILDVCASPGGKSVFLWRQWRPALLVCNEVIGKRLGTLTSNLSRCKVPAVITSSDVHHLSEAFANTFDFVLADAPCSGQSLVARDMRAPACFHPSTINMNSNRQKRIAAHSAAAVRPGGYFAYTTCTYSIEENEAVAEWLVKKFPELEPVEIAALGAYRSPYSELPCYRLFPERGEGAGGFSVLFRKSLEGEEMEPDFSKVRVVRARKEVASK